MSQAKADKMSQGPPSFVPQDRRGTAGGMSARKMPDNTLDLGGSGIKPYGGPGNSKDIDNFNFDITGVD